jgi:hypothetical protein
MHWQEVNNADVTVFRQRRLIRGQTPYLKTQKMGVFFGTSNYYSLLQNGTRCLFRKSDASRTSCLRTQASSPHGSCPLDSRFRGNDARLSGLAGYV